MHNTKWTWLATITFLVMIYTLIPNQKLWHQGDVSTTHITEQDLIEPFQAIVLAKKIQAEIEANGTVYKNGAMAFRHMNELVRIEMHLSYQLHDERRADLKTTQALIVLGEVRQLSTALRYRGDRAARDRIHIEFVAAKDASPVNWLEFRPYTEKFDWHHRWQLLGRSVLMILPLAFCFFFCLLMRRGLLDTNLVGQAMILLRSAVMSLAWPATIWYFPGPDFRYEVQRTVRGLGYALSLFLGLGVPGMAKAQTKFEKKSKDSAPYGWVTPSLSVQPEAPPTPPKSICKAVVNAEIWRDAKHDAQEWLYGYCGHLAFAFNSRQSLTGGASVIVPYLGIRQKFGSATVTGNIGPLYTFGNKQSFDRVVVAVIAGYKSKRFSALLINKVLLGVDGKTPLADRHVQTIRGPPGWWVGFQGEQLHTQSGKFTEQFSGPIIYVGEIFKKTPKWLRGLYAYPYYDNALRAQPLKQRFDCRVGYVYSYSFGQ